MQQTHAGFFDLTAAFAMIALWAGCYDVQPGVRTANVAWDDVVDGEIIHLSAAILAGVAISAQNLLAYQTNGRSGAMDHLMQANDRRTGKVSLSSTHRTATIQYEGGLFGEHQPQGAMHVANVERLKIGIENQHSFHSSTNARDYSTTRRCDL